MSLVELAIVELFIKTYDEKNLRLRLNLDMDEDLTVMSLTLRVNQYRRELGLEATAK